MYKKFFCRPNSFHTMAVYTKACVESQFSGICSLQCIRFIIHMQVKGGYKSPHNWLMRLGIDLAILCVMWNQKQHQLMPSGCFQFTQTFNPPLCGSPPLPVLHPCRSTCGIGVASKKLSKMVGNSASYPFNSLCMDRL